MTGDAIVTIVMRYVHIVSAILAVGGSAFISLCLLPSMRLVDDTFRESLMKLTATRFTRVIWAAIAGLVLSGTWQWLRLADQYKAMGPLGNALIGSKVLVAVILFVIVWAQQMELIKLKQRVYLLINLHLAAVVILLGSILRCLRLESMSV